MNRILSALIIPLLIVLFTLPLYAEETKYTCPMHPHYISETFGSCPICGMDLVPIQVADEKGEVAEDDKGLHLSSHLVQTTGLRSSIVETAFYGRSIRSFGEVVANKRLQTDISLRVEGWIEELVVNAPGDKVKTGDILFRLYSPDLISAQQDYLSAIKQGNRERIDITRNRLSSIGIHDSALSLIAQNRQILRAVPYYAPEGGRVENLEVRQGSYLRPGDIALRIQSYNSVWIDVSLAEQDISFVTKDSQVDVVFPSFGLRMEAVSIDYISPTVDPKTRTAKLRLLVENENGNIRPGAYADVVINTDIRPRLSMPYESVLENKQGSYVIVQKDDGSFLARPVVLGIVNKGRVEVQSGLDKGDVVITSGQFLIDSESSLRESFQKMQKMSARLSEMNLSDEQMVLINHILESGLYIHEKLIENTLPSPDVVRAGSQAAAKLLVDVEGTRLVYIVKDAGEILAGSEHKITLSEWRTLLATLIEALEPWVVEGRPDYYRDLGIAMFISESGERWIQFAGDARNPYAEASSTEIILGSSLKVEGVQGGQ